MDSNEIQNRQNEERLLKIQYAARVYYNYAEVANYFVWLLCLASAFSVFLPESLPKFLPLAIPLVANLAAFCLMIFVNHQVKRGAQLRKNFDAYVLGINSENLSETNRRLINEISNKVYSKNPAVADIQIRNSGKDDPPGVYDWYVFHNTLIDASAQFECQRQNAWWDKKLFYKRLTVTILVAIVILILGMIMFIGTSKSKIIIVACFAGLVIKAAERLVANGKYIMLSERIEGTVQVVESTPTKENVERLQDLIDERRSCVVLGINWLHKKFANMLSKSYESSVC